MGSDASSEPGAYVGQLADHARKLQRDAQHAIAQGDYARASALIGDAEMLAEDVHILVDDIEHRQIDRMMGLAASDGAAAAKTRLGRRRGRFTLPPRKVRMALGTGLAMSLALVEC
ncbi:hypothetical protein C0V72_14610 [Porphyrobacter sp. TH134]|nr:hypothetical protein C0V72_14610 [Porphyrobacter sp. TH134]